MCKLTDNIAEETAPPFREHPSRLFVETTTRCNLACPMCMKQAGGMGTDDGDLAGETFALLEPAFPHLESLVLNGIGEPLLHPGLEEFLGRAKGLMPAGSWVGFQTNGFLMTEARARSLLAAGLDRVCLSMDGVTPATFRTLRAGGELAAVEAALAALAAARSVYATADLRVGVEFVAMANNLRELPSALRWAAARGASFAIVSHLLPYDAAHASRSLFDTCTDAALSLFHAWRVKSRVAGVAIERYFDVLWRFARTPAEQRIVDFVEALRHDARGRGVTLDMRRLLALDWARLEEVHEVFEEAREVAAETGLELRLPEAAPQARRRCAFVEEGSAFVSWDGKVHPCHFLWHGCHSAANGWEQNVHPKILGSLAEGSLLEIWNGEAFRSFRENVLGYDYPYCTSCALAPCDYLQTESFEQDCYVNREPCGSCLWCMGMFHCLS
ncbi:MAG TPA: radical SAM/SPASM family putative metalloenzyme maturase [Geobacteraceae bacterium]